MYLVLKEAEMVIIAISFKIVFSKLYMGFKKRGHESTNE